MKENNFEHIGIVDFLMFEHPDGRTERIQEDLVFINKEYV